MTLCLKIEELNSMHTAVVLNIFSFFTSLTKFHFTASVENVYELM